MESIRVEKTDFDRNECLIKMLMRKSEDTLCLYKVLSVLKTKARSTVLLVCIFIFNDNNI